MVDKMFILLGKTVPMIDFYNRKTKHILYISSFLDPIHIGSENISNIILLKGLFLYLQASIH